MAEGSNPFVKHGEKLGSSYATPIQTAPECRERVEPAEHQQGLRIETSDLQHGKEVRRGSVVPRYHVAEEEIQVPAHVVRQDELTGAMHIPDEGLPHPRQEAAPVVFRNLMSRRRRATGTCIQKFYNRQCARERHMD